MLSRSSLTIAVVAVVLVVGVTTMWLTRAEDEVPRPPSIASREPDAGRIVQRACKLAPELLVRIWRGYDPTHSPEVIFVPKEPNFSGATTRVTHSGPWDYLQRVPLVFYGPGHIEATGRVDRHVNVTDVYATMGELLDVELPRRPSQVLDEALAEPDGSPPKLVMVVIWDGVGNNVLQLWPDAWPNLARLERIGTSYHRATVGSSPSVTPATHSSLGTGAFPREHKMVSIEYRGADGEMREAFEESDPRQLKLTTFVDEIDRYYDNESKMGLLGWTVGGNPTSGPGAWITNHLGMLGHGTVTPGGDADEVALVGDTGNITANHEIYTFPRYLRDFDTLEAHAAELDRTDGAVDGEWLGQEILASHENPAWVDYQLDILTTMIRESDYGNDDIPDVLLTNFKMTDTSAHNHTIDSPELAAVLESQDAALGDLVEFLDEEVGDYVLLVSADHGHTRNVEKTGAWAITPQELISDLDERFDVPEERSLVEAVEPVGFYIDRDLAASLDVEMSEIAGFLNGYTVRDNWKEDELPAGYEDRGSEQVHAAAFAGRQIPAIMKCAFGSETPPEDLDA